MITGFIAGWICCQIALLIVLGIDPVSIAYRRFIKREKFE